jgi:hypothetical protein
LVQLEDNRNLGRKPSLSQAVVIVVVHELQFEFFFPTTHPEKSFSFLLGET